MDTFMAVLRSPMVMDTVEETMLFTPLFSTVSTESIIFPGSISRDCVHLTISGLFPDILSIHFWNAGIFSSIFFPTFTNVAASSGTTTSITITTRQITKQMASTRLTGRASFFAAFFSCFRAFPNKWCSINFIGTFRINAIPKPTINGKRNPSNTCAVLIMISRFCTPRYSKTANAISHRIFFIFSLSNCIFSSFLPDLFILFWIL